MRPWEGGRSPVCPAVSPPSSHDDDGFLMHEVDGSGEG